MGGMGERLIIVVVWPGRMDLGKPLASFGLQSKVDNNRASFFMTSNLKRIDGEWVKFEDAERALLRAAVVIQYLRTFVKHDSHPVEMANDWLKTYFPDDNLSDRSLRDEPQGFRPSVKRGDPV